jgi:ASPM-SPD-2-Hydin domain-containing protein
MATAFGRARSARAALICTLALGVFMLSAGGVAAGGPPAPFTVSPASLDFGTVTVGSSGTQTLTVTASRNKSAAMVITTNGGQLAVDGGTCVDLFLQLAAGASCTLDITYAPVGPESLSGTLTITNCATFVLNVNGFPVCNRSHGTVDVPYVGTASF